MKASILVNNYNYARYLDACLRSALGQTQPCEVILYDDGSTDDSRQVWSRYPVDVIANPNYGKDPSFNQANAITQALRRSTGDIIVLLDADDVCLPHRVARIVEAFADPRVVCVQHRMYEIDAEGRRTGGIRVNVMMGVDVERMIYATGRLEYFFLQTSGLAFRRELLEKLLPIDETKYPLVWADVRLTRAAVFAGRVVTLAEPLGEYRFHDLGDSKKRRTTSFYAGTSGSPEAFERDLGEQQLAYFNEVAVAHGAPPLVRGSKAMFYACAVVWPQRPDYKATFFYRMARGWLGLR